MKKKTDPYAALRYPQYVSLISGNMLLTMAGLIQEVVISYELYKITHDPLTLGFVGLAEAIPYIALALFGGHYADRREKRGILQLCLGLFFVCSLLLLWITLPHVRVQFSQTTFLLLVYGILALIGFARGFYSPTSSSLKGFLTPREVYTNAATWSSSFWQFGMIVGPGVAGFLYAYLGLTNSFYVVLTLLFVCFISISNIKKQPVPETTGEVQNIWKSIGEGIDFVFKHKIILYSISLDLAAVLFGGVIAILPVFAEDILKVGAEGLGILRASPSIGAVLTILMTAYFPPTQNAWRNMLIAVAGFGMATIVFALSTNFYLSIVMLFLTGAFDAISVVVRQTIMQVIPPDNMRGRVGSVNSVFVSASNEIGAFESGVAAKFMGTVPSVLFGGGLTLLIVGWVWSQSKEAFKTKLV